MTAKSFRGVLCRFISGTAWLFAAAFLFLPVGCSDGNSSRPSGQQSGTASETDIFSETEYVEGVIYSLTTGRTLFVELESPTGTPLLEDTDIIGTDVFRLALARETLLDLCHSGVDPDHITFLRNQDGATLLSLEAGDESYSCESEGLEPVLLSAGEYTLEMVHNNTDSPLPDVLLVSLQSSEPVPTAQTSSDVPEPDSLMLTVAAPEPYDFDKEYTKTDTVVSYKGAYYQNKWYASKGHCPVEADCPVPLFEDGLWKAYDPSVKHEFAYYDYEALKQSYPAVPQCSAEDYSLERVQSVIDESAATGEISEAAPDGGFSAQDLEALFREYMLPCRPDLQKFEPENVKRVREILPESLWNTFAAKTAVGDTGRTYTNAEGESVPWPSETGFKSNTYENFLKAVARYPYFCGEKGYFGSTEEACKRELASLFSHAAFETGNKKLEQSFYWLREFGYVNQKSFFNDGCAPPLDCKTNGWARYYGRGPKQLTYFYNYAGFSASYFLGNYNFLLLWPDLVAYDGEMYFLAAVYYVMTNQPPKPSLHDVLLGRYSPSDKCVNVEDCFGVQHDPVSGVKQNFDISIEVVNGGVQCRPGSSAEFKEQAKERTRAYLDMLKRLGATLTEGEQSMVEGCGFITTKDNTVFADDRLKAGLRTWIDLSEKSCKAQSRGGLATISVTATGIVDACRR